MGQLLPFAPLAATLLLGLRHFLFPGFSPVTFLLLSFLVIIFLPGLVLAELSFDRRHYTLPEWAAVSFSLGLAALTPPVVAAHILKMPVENLFYYLLFLISFPSAVFLGIHWSHSLDQSSKWLPGYEDSFHKIVWYVLWALILFVGLRDFSLYQRVEYTGDIYYDWGEITKFLASPHNYGLHPYVKGIYTDAMHLYQIPVLLTAIMIKAGGGLEVYAANAYLNIPSYLLLFSAHYFLLASFFKNRSLVLFTLFLSLWSLPLIPWLTVSWTQVLFETALGLIFRRLNSGGRFELPWAVILGSVLFMFRVTTYSIYFSSLTLLAAAILVFNHQDRDTLRTLGKIICFGFILSLPFVYLKLSHPAMNAFRVTSEYHSWRIIKIGWSMFYINPLNYIYHSYFAVLALVISPWLLTFRNKPWALFLFVTLVVPIFIQFVPPIATIVSYFLSYLFVWKILAMQIFPDLILKVALYLFLVKISGQLIDSKTMPKRSSRIFPLLISGVALLFMALVIILLVNYVIGHPEFRSSLREWFISNKLEVIWVHKHLLLVMLPVMLWIVFAVIRELRKRHFSSQADKPIFLGLESSGSKIPLIIAIAYAYGAFFFTSISAFREEYRNFGRFYQSLEERLGPPPGVDYLRKNVLKPAIVLADPETSVSIPSYSVHYAFTTYPRRIGNLFKTKYFNIEERLEFVRTILQTREMITDTEFRSLKENGISYIYLTRQDTPPEIFRKFDSCINYFTKRFESPSDAIYEVRAFPKEEKQ